MRLRITACLVFLVGIAPCRNLRSQETDRERRPIARTVADHQPMPETEPPTIEPQTVVGVVEGEGDEPIVTSPTSTPELVGEFGGTVRMIGPDEIARSRERTVSQLLRRVPGVDVVQNGPAGGLTTVFLRGAASQHTKVFLDGIPLNDPSNASRLFDFGNMLLDNVERIEGLQGPQSLLYGSDALGGVIQITSKRGSGPRTTTLLADGGSFHSHREQVAVQAGSDQFHYAFTGSWNQTRGFSAASPRVGGVDHDGFEAGVVSGRVGWTPSEDLEVDYVFRWIDSRMGLDDASFSLGSPPTDDPLRTYVSENFFNRVQLRKAMMDGLIVQRASFFLTDFDRNDKDDIFPTSFEGQTRKFLYQADLQLTEENVFSAGADYTAEDGSSDGAFGAAGATQNDAGVFIQDQIRLAERWFTTVGFRWDDHSAAGTAQTYRMTSTYRLFDWGTDVRGSIGTGFRAPALAENLFPFGNPGLRPETSKGWEYGIDQALFDGDVRIGATYFRNDFRDLILFDLNTFTLMNIGTARTHGVELSGRVDLTACVFITGGYTVMDTMDGETGGPLVRRPRHKASMAVTRTFCDDRVSLSCAGQFVGDRTDARDASVWLDDYTVFNVSGDYLLFDDVRLYARINNLFDKRYEEVTGFAASPFAAFAGAEWTY